LLHPSIFEPQLEYQNGLQVLNQLYQRTIRELKGVTLYVDGSREGQILNPIDRDEAMKYLKEGKVENPMDAVQCASGKCEM
jgi:hypothetical protein